MRSDDLYTLPAGLPDPVDDGACAHLVGREIPAVGYRDHHQELTAEGAEVFGLSTQDTEYQREMAQRLHLPFEVLSDAKLMLTRELNLSTFRFGDRALLKRHTGASAGVASSRCSIRFFPPMPTPNECSCGYGLSERPRHDSALVLALAAPLPLASAWAVPPGGSGSEGYWEPPTSRWP